ncbi:MAG: chorismate synthase [Chloroflexi bacterium]|nr:chorismate synthase [Chloroflexota bacterium]
MRFLTAGESHGPCLTGILEGLPAGLQIDAGAINEELRRRQGGYGRGGRQRIEQDRAEILSGVDASVTIGAPVALRVENKDWVNWKDKAVPPWHVPRPGHADLGGSIKYRIPDMRLVAERASARETAMRVAIGAICKQLLREFGVRIGSFVTEIGGVAMPVPNAPYEELFLRAEESDVRCPDPEWSERMHARIRETMSRRDTVGGVFMVVATGVPVGLGSHVHWDRKLDGRLAAAVMSIHAIKGVEIGPAFENARKFGTEVHDEVFASDPANASPFTRHTNRAGGLEGGITNGQPVVVRAAMKPISTTLTPLRSINTQTGEATTTNYTRSDICAVPAASVVGEAMVAWVLAEALQEKYGGDSLAEMLEHYRCGA